MLALCALGLPTVHGQTPSAASAPAAASAASPAGAAAPTASSPVRRRTMPPAARGGSQSEAMHACRSLHGEQAQNDCMLHHQAMPPEGAASSGPPRRP